MSKGATWRAYTWSGIDKATVSEPPVGGVTVPAGTMCGIDQGL